jgi:cysteine-rich repeat protein
MSGLGVGATRGLRTPPLAALFVLVPSLITACDGEESTYKPPSGATSTGASQGGDGGSGGSGGTSGSGGSGASAGASGSAGDGGSGGSSPCGNGMIDVGEACDGETLGDATCETQGFPGGTIACSPACELDISGCTGADDCTDGIDNDGDGLADCAERDCQAVCADACLAPIVLADPDDTSGSTVGHASMLKSSCAADSAGEVVYAVTAVITGMLDAVVIEDGSASFSVSIRTDCASDASEVACSATLAGAELSKKVSVPIAAGQTAFVVVDTDGSGAEGSFTISVASRSIECGDGNQDAAEACDDGNLAAGDGCSAACAVEATDLEPNDTLQTASPFAEPYYASIDPEGDVDYVQIDLPSSAGLIVSTLGLGGLACSDGTMDSVVSILDAAGDPIAVNDDAGGGSLCSKAAAAALPAGTYYAKIEAAPLAGPSGATFPYGLSVTTFQCGDGVVSPGEECDDGGAANGDGCSSACAFEVTETEQNGTLATADVYTSPWVARIDPDGDVDVVSVSVPGPASSMTVTTKSPDGTACFPGADSHVEILSPNGDVLQSNDDQGSYCSQATATGLASGKYYVRVKATPLLDQTVTYIFPYALEITID